MTIIHKSPLPDIEIADVSITDYVLRKADELPDKPAFIDGGNGRVITFSELKDYVQRFAGGLANRGFGVGSTLALVAPNIPEYAVVFHGCGVAGGTVTTVNPTYGAEEVRFQLLDASATILVTVEAAMPIALEAIEGTDVKEIIVIGEHPNATSLSEVLTAEPIDQVEVDLANHHVVLPYSSGTTGLPKGVMLTHRNLVANLCQCESAIPYDQDSSGLAVLPFFHIYGMQVLMNGLLANGCTVISMPRFDLVQALELIQEHKITHFFAVPPMILALAKQPFCFLPLGDVGISRDKAAAWHGVSGNKQGCAIGARSFELMGIFFSGQLDPVFDKFLNISGAIVSPPGKKNGQVPVVPADFQHAFRKLQNLRVPVIPDLQPLVVVIHDNTLDDMFQDLAEDVGRFGHDTNLDRN